MLLHGVFVSECQAQYEYERIWCLKGLFYCSSRILQVLEPVETELSGVQQWALATQLYALCHLAEVFLTPAQRNVDSGYYLDWYKSKSTAVSILPSSPQGLLEMVLVDTIHKIRNVKTHKRMYKMMLEDEALRERHLAQVDETLNHHLEWERQGNYPELWSRKNDLSQFDFVPNEFRSGNVFPVIEDEEDSIKDTNEVFLRFWNALKKDMTPEELRQAGG